MLTAVVVFLRTIGLIWWRLRHQFSQGRLNVRIDGSVEKRTHAGVRRLVPTIPRLLSLPLLPESAAAVSRALGLIATLRL
jgi:hypothetical protein